MNSENKIVPRILLIDDDASLVQVMIKMVKKWGYEMTVATNGEEGMLKAQEERPDLVILDVMMPGMNGWTFIQKFKSIPQYNKIPVIFLTALKTPKERIKGLQLGANDYIQKPFYFDELRVRVDNLLKTTATENAQESDPSTSGNLK